jgi:hypothetical protein
MALSDEIERHRRDCEPDLNLRRLVVRGGGTARQGIEQ